MNRNTIRDVDIDYTCPCGLYVHPSRRNMDAYHISDCPWYIDIERSSKTMEAKLQAIAQKYGDLQLKYWSLYHNTPPHWTVELVNIADDGTLSEYELIGSGSTMVEAIEDAYANYYE